MRHAIASIVLLAAAVLPVWAQTAVPRIGLLGPDEEPRFSDITKGLKHGLREHGYSEARIEVVEIRVARGEEKAARGRIARLSEARLGVLFVIGSSLARLARGSDAALPIVFVTPGDPVAAGLLASFARPGRNMTALTFEYPELSAKRLELLRDLGPNVRRVLVLYDPRDASPRQGVDAARAAARALGLTLTEVQVRNKQEIDDGLQKLDEVDALLGVPGGITTAYYEAMIRAANSRRRPTILFTHSPSTRDALLSYGASDIEVAQQAARVLAKILQGANAGEIPVERPTKVTLVVNLKTAKLLNIAIPPALLLRADRVMQ